MQTLQYLKMFFVHENIKKTPSNVAHNRPQFFFQCCQPTENQLKSQFLFHKICSPRDLCVITLSRSAVLVKAYISRDLSYLMIKFPSLDVWNLSPLISRPPWYHLMLGLGAPKVWQLIVTDWPSTVRDCLAGGL